MKTSKRITALALALGIILSLMPTIAFAADGDDPYESDGIFESLGLSTALPAGVAENSSNTPFGRNKVEKLKMSEVFTVVGTDSWLYGHNIDLETRFMNMVPTLGTVNLPNGALVSAMEGRFTEKVQANLVAALVATPDNGSADRWDLSLVIIDPLDEDGKVSTIASSLGTLGGVKLDVQAALKLSVCDLDGNGIDEIVTLLPASTHEINLAVFTLATETNEDGKIVPKQYSTSGNWERKNLEHDATSDSSPSANLVAGMGSNESNCALSGERTHFTLSTGDMNGDGLADIAVSMTYIIGFQNTYAAGAAPSEWRALTFISEKNPAEVLYKTQVINRYTLAQNLLTPSQNGLYIQFPEYFVPAAYILDADGDGIGELYFGGAVWQRSYQTNLPSSQTNSLHAYYADRFDYNRVDGHLLRNSSQDDGGSKIPLLKMESPTLLNLYTANEPDALINTHRDVYHRYPVNMLAVPTGGNTMSRIRIKNATFTPESPDDPASAYSGSISGVNASIYLDMRFSPTNTTGEGAVIIRRITMTGESIIRYDDLDSTDVKDICSLSAPYSTVLLALPDTDNDSVYLEYKGYNLFFSDPKVLAALASPPYFRDLLHVEGGDTYVYGSSTSFGETTGQGSEVKKTDTFSLGAYVAVDVETTLGPPLAGGVVIKNEIETSYDHGWTWETSERKTIQHDITYTTMGGQDSVVLYAVPFDIFEYTMYYPKDVEGTKYDNAPYQVRIPYEPVVSVIPISKYNKVYAEYSDILPDVDKEVFTHTLGEPSSYPTPSDVTASKFNDCIFDAGKLVGVGSGGSSVTQSVSITNENGKGTTNSNKVSFKAGLGAGIKAGDTTIGVESVATVTAGIQTSWEGTSATVETDLNGTSYTTVVCGVPVAADGYNYGFDWTMLQYNYRQGEDHQFPVVSYVVRNARKATPLPLSLDVKGVTTETVTLTWEPSSADTILTTDGANSNIIYAVYKMLNASGTKNPYIRTEPITFNKTTGKYEYTEVGLSPGTAHEYYIVAATKGVSNSESIPSKHVTATTTPIGGGGFTSQPQSIELRPGVYGQLEAEFDRGNAGKVTYSWMKKLDPPEPPKAPWAPVPSTNAANLQFSDPKASDAGTYRLDVVTEDPLAEYFSNEVTVTYLKYDSAVSGFNVSGTDTLTFSGSVTSDTNVLTPSGTVNISIVNGNNSYDIPATLSPNGGFAATYNAASLAPGVYPVVVKYPGNGAFKASQGETTLRHKVEQMTASTLVIIPERSLTGIQYGDTREIQVLKYSATELDGDDVTASGDTEYNLEKYDTNAWVATDSDSISIENGVISFKELGRYRLTVSDNVDTNAKEAVVEFNVLPRSLTLKFADVSTTKGITTMPAPTLEVVSSSGTLASGDVVDNFGFVAELRAMDVNGNAVTLSSTTPAGTYRITRKDTSPTPDQTKKQQLYNLKVEDGTYVIAGAMVAVTYGVEGSVGGSVSVTNMTLPSGGTVEEGTSVHFTAVPPTGYKVKEWKVGGSTVNGTNNVLTRTISADTDVKVSFEVDSRVLTFGANDPAGGSVSETNGAKTGSTHQSGRPLEFKATATTAGSSKSGR